MTASSAGVVAQFINAAHHLRHIGGRHAMLATTLATWINEHDVAPRQPVPPQRQVVEHVEQAFGLRDADLEG